MWGRTRTAWVRARYGCGTLASRPAGAVGRGRVTSTVREVPFSTATERDALCSFLDQARDALIRKVDGLSDKDARTASTVSSLSLLSLLKHSAIWEHRWFQIIFAGHSFPDEWPAVNEDRDATFALGEDDTVESVLAYYLEQIAVSREITASADLDARCVRTDLVDENLRWVAMHLIQETARHAGHADIIREAIDGSRGL